MRKVVLFAAALFCTATAFALGTLDGKNFQGIIAERGSDATKGDEFTFAGGKFKSSVFSGLGYGAGSYTATPDEKSVRFEARSVHKNGAVAKWAGMVRGQDIEGSVTVLERSGAERRSWFKGRLK